jgi:hypothetical protein
VSEAFTRSIPRNRNRRSRGNTSKSAGIVEAISSSRLVMFRLANQNCGTARDCFDFQLLTFRKTCEKEAVI